MPVRGEQKILALDLCRNKDLWGEDAHEMRPERWLDGSLEKDVKQATAGVYSNLSVFLFSPLSLQLIKYITRMTFSGGARSCVAWRFA